MITELRTILVAEDNANDMEPSDGDAGAATA